MSEQRTKWAEDYFRGFASIPLTAECVFYSPQYLKGGIQKEVCDFLLILKGEAVLVSMKSQEDPKTRTGDKLKQWTIKSVQRGLEQAQGALRTIKQRPFWCEHLRRGRVDFEAGSINVIHAIVITELVGELIELPDSLPLAIDGVPVTYLSVNDFLNLINELRAFRDIAAYLEARRILPARSLREVGDEIPYYKYFILNEHSFAGCHSYEDARITVAARQSDFDVYLTFRPLKNRFTSIIECVSDRLATRHKYYAEGLDAKVVALYDDPQKRKNYLLMQEELCDFNLAERQGLGMQFTRLMEKIQDNNKTENMAYGVGFLDSKPDFVYVFVSSKGIDRGVLIDRMVLLLRSAMTAYDKRRGMVIADRDGENFELCMMANFTPSENDRKLAEHFFAHLRIDSFRMT